MYPDPSTLTLAQIQQTTFLLDRTDIYNRLRCIAELHTGDKQHNGAKGFFVGREYEINTENLNKLDVQKFKTKFPKYFYSEAFNLSGKKAKEVRADFPLIFVTPGERSIIPNTDRKRSSYELDFVVFDLMYYDRNNKNANETAFREKEDIWRDTEKILDEVLYAYQDNDNISAIYNRCFSGFYLGYPEDVSTWSESQNVTADALSKRLLISGNFSCQIITNIMPFEYKHNRRLAGVHTVVSTNIFTGCPDGQFIQKLC